MTPEQITADDQIIAEYSKYDEAFRKAKKAGNHKVASQYKAKRDALDAEVDAAIKRRVARKQQGQ